MKRRITNSVINILFTTCFISISVVQAMDYDTGFRPERKNHLQASGLVGEVRQATKRFRDVNEATAAGYGVFLGCVSGHQEGAMGIQYVNGSLVGDGSLDASRPEALVYEATPHGKLRLVAVEFVTIAEAWHANNVEPPTLSGQTFHYSGSPNRYGLPPFYALHVWAWKYNPSGMFVNWNPRVSCKNYPIEAQ